MPRDRDKNNVPPRGRREGRPAARGPGGKGAVKGSGAKGPGAKGPGAKGPGAKGRRDAGGPGGGFAKRAPAGKFDGERRSFGAKSGGGQSSDNRAGGAAGSRGAVRRDGDAPRPARFSRDDRPARSGDRPDRGPRKEFRSSRAEAGETRSHAPRRERPSDGRRNDGPSRPQRDAARDFRPQREGARKFERPRSDKPRFDAARGEGRSERPRVPRPRDAETGRDRKSFERPGPRRERDEREARPTFRRPREDRKPSAREAWQDHPRSEGRRDRFTDRPRRDNEDDSRIFAKRPAFGGRGAYRARKPEDRQKQAPPEPRADKTGERIAKLMARAGLASRRDAEEWVKQGRVTVNGRVINSPALDITASDVVLVDGKPLPERERIRLFLYHKPRGLMTTHADPEGRPTVFEHLPDGLPRLISVGRLDFNTEGLLLLTNDGGLARVLELPDTGWLRRYRVRAHGEVTQPQLDGLRDGVEIDGVKYGPVEAVLEREQGSNVWITIAIREGKNREVRNILGALGLEVNRLIRVSYGPFQLGEIPEGEVEEVRGRVLRDQLGERIAQRAGVDLGAPSAVRAAGAAEKPRAKRSVVEDRKGRRVVVQRTGSEEAKERNDAVARGRPQRPKRGYHGKRDLKPRD